MDAAARALVAVAHNAAKLEVALEGGDLVKASQLSDSLHLILAKVLSELGLEWVAVGRGEKQRARMLRDLRLVASGELKDPDQIRKLMKDAEWQLRVEQELSVALEYARKVFLEGVPANP